jgi:tetratricopeptide (TPR) repeat protein
MLGDAYSKKAEDALAYQEYVLAAEAYIKQGLADKANIIYKKIGRLDSEKLPEKERQKQILIKKHTTAEKFIESGEIDKAIEEYKDIIKLNPANFETYQKLADLYAEKGDKESAQEYYKKIVDLYFKNRLYKKALPIYQKILEMSPDNIGAREKIAEIYEREANESDAKREYLFLAEYYWKEKNIEKTDFYAKKAVEFKSIEAHFFLGAAQYEKKELGEAKKEMEMLLKFKANHAGALTIMACIFRDMGQMDEAMGMFEKVMKAEPENTDALEELAGFYVKKGLNKDAIAKFLVAEKILNSKQQHAKAEEILKKAAALEPENIDILSRMGEAFGKQNKKKEAADTFIKISEIYRKENMPDKAAEYYKMAQGTDPGNTKIVDAAKKMAVEPPKPAAPPPAPPKPEAAAAPAAPKTEPAKPANPPPPETAADKPPAFKITHSSSSFGQKPAAPPPAAAPKPEAPAAAKPPDPVKPAEPPKPAQEQPAFKITHNVSSFQAKPEEPKAPPAKPAEPVKPAAPQPPKKAEEDLPITLPDIDLFGVGPKKPVEAQKPAAPEPVKPPAPALQPAKPSFVPPGPSDDDIPSMIAMADSYVLSGSFDEAIEMYQKALAMDPGNTSIKKKLTEVYSKYAGMPVAQAPSDAEAKKKEEEAGKKAEEEARKKKEEEDKKKRAEEEAKKKADDEAKKKKEEEDKKKRAEEEAKKKADDEARKKKEEEDKKKKAEEEAKKKREEEEKKKKAAADEELVDDEYSDDFVTVTTAEIFIKQGLFTEAQKILNKILKKDPANIEAKMKLDEMKKLMAETEAKGENVMDEKIEKGKASKVTYI